MVYLPHAFGIGTDASPRSIAFGNMEAFYFKYEMNIFGFRV